MKSAYSAITLRYVHDVVAGEFANIGVVLYAPEQRFLRARFAASYERLEAMFLNIDRLDFSALIRCLANGFDVMGAQIQNNATIPPVNSWCEMVKRILPPDDGSLQWSEQGGGFTDDPEKTLKQLFNRFVGRYQSAAKRETSKTILTDLHHD